MKKLNKLLLSTLLATASTSIFSAQEEDKRDFVTTEVAPNIYMISGVGGFTGGNIGLSIGDDGVVMIDDSMPPLLDKMKAAIKKVTDSPIDFLVNTHVHGDHIGHNHQMGKNGTRIVAHENLRLNMLEKGMPAPKGKVKATKESLPVITFSHSMNFHLNGEDARIIHLPKAHTDGDAIIHFKQANVIHAGDVFFNQLFPYIDYSNGGSIEGYIKGQQKIIKMSNDETKIIPGHGKLSNKKELKQAVDMLIDAHNLIKKMVSENMSEDEVVKANPLAKYHDQWNWGFITTEKMTRQVYKGLSK